jgi:TAT (twin-arginine translocation) pathway signal sequence
MAVWMADRGETGGADMSDMTRRSFFKHAGVAAAAVGAVAVAPGGLISPGSAVAQSKPLSPEELSSSEPIVAHLTDVEAGRITLFVGTREVHVRDHEFAARIVRAAR